MYNPWQIIVNQSMNKTRVLLIFIFSIVLTPLTFANESMYLNGEVNPAYMMQTAVIFGEVVEIKTTPNGKRFYYVDQKLKGVNPVAVYFFYTLEENEIKVGDRVQFTGHFKPVKKMESTGQLEKFLGKKMVLYSRVWLKP